jgi:sterol desaturase/sphingolipid hydroxylase (fatty acid hydroxylase superfamily)
MEKIRRLLGKRKPLEERKPLKKVRIYRIRMHLCKTGILLLLLSFVLAVASIYEPRFIPLFIFCLVDYVITVIPAFYIEDLEVQ